MKGCLLIHGFTGSPFEVEPLAKHLQETTDWEIRMPTLPGHGTELHLKGVTNQEWLNYAEDELQDLLAFCDEVYLIGFSMGGLIAGYLASKYPVKKLVLLSAAAYYINPRQLLFDIKDMIKDGLRGNLKENVLYLRYKKKITDTPFRATLEFRTLVNKIRPKLRDIDVPTLIIQGECDGIVPVKSAQFLYDTISSKVKKICLLPQSKHHVCHGEDIWTLFSEVDAFLLND
ncbi:alpha/beta fold hydrolase [Bacillus luteolus]|uniref:Alpha/beta fold hydrolase n=1 Tax=Litchfieldia luteola TaxID=682179 RepID=A0ABR9QMF5_9BACI|nr:alpha/beta fold hydrolase [Cytobacillus luteolus]MBE4909677.1 alpha/beta fold hydrolase [Cytobacillus luteolus]MBP1944569.1 esterase/lipase [Cytobacillus luteolus]